MSAMLEAMGVGRGDEVVLQGFTCLAVPAPILGLGATPVYADVNPSSLNLDATTMARVLSPRTRVVVVQHSFGIPADLGPILELARARGLWVVEDCCHTLGARYDGRPVGSFGHGAFHSYEWGKPLVIGVGGTAVLNDPGLAAAVGAVAARFVDPPVPVRLLIEAQYAAFRLLMGRSLYWTLRDLYRLLARSGAVVGSFRAEELLGAASPEYGYRMIPGLRGRLQRQLAGLDADTARRRDLARLYADRIAGLRLPMPEPGPRQDPVLVKFPVCVGNKAALLAAARQAHVELYDMFASAVHPFPADALGMAGYRLGSCPRAECLADTVVSLPMGGWVTAEAVDRAAEFLARHARPPDDD